MPDRRVSELFGLRVDGAMRYASTLDDNDTDTDDLSSPCAWRASLRVNRCAGHTGCVSMISPAASVVGRLTAAGCVAASGEAEQLIGAAPDDDALELWIRRREQGEPLAWIIGTARFCGHTVNVDPGVYVPRYQTEELARRASELLPTGGSAVDLCTGAGAVAVHLMAEVSGATVVGTDIDQRAALCAQRNGVVVLIAELGEPLRSKAFDLVTVVAPYVPTAKLSLLPADVQRYEPRLALDGGGDGLDVVRRIVVTASRLLRPGGWLLAELGGDQHNAIAPILESSGFSAVTTWFDEDDDLRGIAAQATGT
ncbi:MAG: N5-glutamine methyltransferase family protein [Acidimicrobiales bacterium]